MDGPRSDVVVSPDRAQGQRQVSPKKLAAKIPDLVPQEHGGALLTGGVPGHDGSNAGRKPDAFKAWLATTLDRPGFREAFEKKMDAGDIKAAEYATAYVESKPAQQHKVDATVVFKAEKE
jgi:hypothetical protein